LVLAAPTRDFIDNRSTFRVPDSIIKVGYGLMEQDLAKMDSALSYKDIDALVSRLETLGIGPYLFHFPSHFLQKDVDTIRLKLTPWCDSTKIQSYETELSLPWVQ
jgi:hypothetical protein